MVDKKEINCCKDRLLWSYFLNTKEELEYRRICVQCKNDCKQSFSIGGIRCPIIYFQVQAKNNEGYVSNIPLFL